jgi:hypothetical protein
MASRGGRILLRCLRKRKYNLACVEDEVSVRDILSEEFDIVSSDELNSEGEGECPSDESSNMSTESECESETSVCTDGWEYALFAQNFRGNQLAQWLCGDLKSP